MIYAVNKRTKEHRICRPEISDHMLQPAIMVNAGERTVEADADGWIPWHGGECPLPDGELCAYKMRGGCGSTDAAGDVEWRHIGLPTDVVAYKPVLDTRPVIDVTRLVSERQPPAWHGEGLPPVGARVEIEDGCKGTVLAAAHLKRQGARAWLELDDGDQRVPSVECIRPIRSEEDRAIEAMRAALDNPILIPDCVYEGIYAAIRDGKIPGVRLDD